MIAFSSKEHSACAVHICVYNEDVYYIWHLRKIFLIENCSFSVTWIDSMTLSLPTASLNLPDTSCHPSFQNLILQI